MTKFLVNKKDAAAFANADGTYPVVKGVVEIPLGPFAAELLKDGEIRFFPESAPISPYPVAPPAAPPVEEPPVIEIVEEAPKPKKRASK